MPQNRQETLLWTAGFLLLAVTLGIFLFAPAWTQHPNLPPREEMSHGMSDMPGMPGSNLAQPEDKAQKAKHLVDKRMSEFNHRFAGVLVILAASFSLVQARLTKRWPAARYAWPVCFLAAGLFLLIFSDTEIWPLGYQSFYFAVSHDPEVAQHKLFALILFALGSAETLRISGRWEGPWSAFVFPVIALCGAVLLLFHQHGGMHGPEAMETMARVQNQHTKFAGVGTGVALAKGLADSKIRRREIFGRTWPLLLAFLGVLLLQYSE